MAKRDIELLVQYLKETGRAWKAIVAIPRGGLIPATILGYSLGINIVDTVCVKSYKNRERGPLEILKDIHPSVVDLGGDHGKHLLFVDDLVDSGATMRRFREKFPAATFVAPYAKADGLDILDRWVVQVPKGTWFSFYWSDGEPAET